MYWYKQFLPASRFSYFSVVIYFLINVSTLGYAWPDNRFFLICALYSWNSEDKCSATSGWNGLISKYDSEDQEFWNWTVLQDSHLLWSHVFLLLCLRMVNIQILILVSRRILRQNLSAFKKIAFLHMKFSFDSLMTYDGHVLNNCIIFLICRRLNTEDLRGELSCL